jgi:hypothetical protein
MLAGDNFLVYEDVFVRAASNNCMDHYRFGDCFTSRMPSSNRDDVLSMGG